MLEMLAGFLNLQGAFVRMSICSKACIPLPSLFAEFGNPKQEPIDSVLRSVMDEMDCIATGQEDNAVMAEV